MSRPTTLPPDWLALAERLGGIEPLRVALGVSKMTMWRLAHGKTPPNAEMRSKLEALASKYKLKSPLGPPKPPAKKDKRMLELLGEGLSKGIEPSDKMVTHFKSVWPEEKLADLAAVDEDENVLRAVTYLLEV